MKRILAICLCFALLGGILTVAAAETTDPEVQRICDQITDIYYKTLASSGFRDLHGYCGVMAGWELYHLGITDIAITQNGNLMYDMVKDSPHIREGYRVDCYPATEYSLEEALNTLTQCGTKDVYNIMVGFHWTNTAAGQLWGHVNVIHAILDGMVYFTEGFKTPFEADPSKPMICTIAEFAEFYNKWTRFEGLIHFGLGDRIAGYESYGSNLYIQTQMPVTLQTHPDVTQGQRARVVQTGERLKVTAVLQNASGQIFYRIQEGERSFYIPTYGVDLVWFAYDDIQVTDLVLPTQVNKGTQPEITGKLRSQNQIYTVILQVLDENGEVRMAAEIVKNSYMVDFAAAASGSRMDFKKLPAGRYTYNIYCDMVNYYDDGEMMVGDMQRVLVASSNFTVGDVEPLVQDEPVVQTRQLQNGWQYENGLWYYYENDLPYTGWLRQNGVEYYLLEDGSAVTGWQNINGQLRYFTETGALRSGWLETQEGLYYLRSNGVPVTGWYPIDGVRYCFDENGCLIPGLILTAKK